MPDYGAACQPRTDESLIEHKGNSPRNIYVWLLLAVALLAAYVSAAQTTAEPQQQQAKPPSEFKVQPLPQQKLTPKQAAELFKSADEILQFVSKDTGLPIKHKVTCELASRDEVVRYVTQKMAEDEDTQRLERAAVSLKKFGLLPRDFELRPYLLALLKEQVAGFYDSKTKKLYLLDWVDPESQKAVLAHELTHALQDQNFDILKWAEGSGKPKTDAEIIAHDEEASAKQAVIEGQAMITLLNYSLAPLGGSVLDSPQIVEAMKAGMVTGGGSPIYDQAPLFMRQAIIFPYQHGMDFVRGVLVKRGRDAAFAGTMRNPPKNSRQIMMPETYVAGERLPAMPLIEADKLVGKGYERYDFGGIGQFDIGVMIEEWAGEGRQLNVAPGWRGGYYWTGRKRGAMDGPVSMIFVTRWASETQASQFASAYTKAIPKRYAKASAVKEFGESRGEWTTEEGSVRLSVKGELVIAIEGFERDISDKIEQAVIKAGNK